MENKDFMDPELTEEEKKSLEEMEKREADKGGMKS